MSDSSRKSHGIGAAVDKLFRGIEILIAIFLGAMIFFTFMNVILRQFGIGFPWSEEIARICFIYLIYLGAIIAARENQHLMIDTLICKLPPLGQKVLYVIIQGLIIWLMWILTNGAFLNAWNNRNDFWVATHFPVFLVHFAGVLLGASVIIISLVNLYRMFVLKEPVIELLTGHKADDGEDPIAKEAACSDHCRIYRHDAHRHRHRASHRHGPAAVRRLHRAGHGRRRRQPHHHRPHPDAGL